MPIPPSVETTGRNWHIVVNKIEAKDIDLNPDYQRNYVWLANDDMEHKCSRLIESLLLTDVTHNKKVRLIYWILCFNLIYKDSTKSVTPMEIGVQSFWIPTFVGMTSAEAE